jgi:hypothetical protein
MRALHVLDAGAFRRDGGVLPDGAADDAAELCGRLLAHPACAEHRALVLGPAWFIRRAGALGLRPDWAFSPAAGNPMLGWMEVRAAARRAGAQAVCCWSAASERAATAALGRAMPVVRVSADGTGGGPGALASVRRAELDAASLAVPPVAPAGEDRARAREALGLGDRDAAVLLIGGRGDASALRFNFALGLSRHTGTEVVGVLPAWADSLPRSMRFQGRLHRPVRVVVTDRPRREVLRGIDLAMWTGGGRSATWPAEGRPSRLHIAECLASGVPVVAPAGANLEDLYPPGVLGLCMAEVANPPEIARRLIPLVEDASVRAEAASACRAWWRGRDGLPALAAELRESLERATRTGGWAEVVSRQIALGVT